VLEQVTLQRKNDYDSGDLKKYDTNAKMDMM
jgi:hypothetical protein